MGLLCRNIKVVGNGTQRSIFPYFPQSLALVWQGEPTLFADGQQVKEMFCNHAHPPLR
jgi:hypothetical protein